MYCTLQQNIWTLADIKPVSARLDRRDFPITPSFCIVAQRTWIYKKHYYSVNSDPPPKQIWSRSILLLLLLLLLLLFKTLNVSYILHIFSNGSNSSLEPLDKRPFPKEL
jgi:hypothetical protein